MTLTELIIATAIIGIVMVGVVSADFAIHKQGKSSTSDTVSGITAILILKHMMENARLARGNSIDKGILNGTADGMPDDNSFCIRTEKASEPAWSCYSIIHNGAVPPQRFIYTCLKASAAACVNTDENLGEVSSVTLAYTSNSTPGAQTMYFNITLNVPDSASPGNQKSYMFRLSPPLYRI